MQKLKGLWLIGIVFLLGCTQSSNPSETTTLSEGNPLQNYIRSLNNTLPEHFYVKYELRGENLTAQQVLYVNGSNIRMDIKQEGIENRILITDKTMTECTNETGSWFCGSHALTEQERADFMEGFILTSDQVNALSSLDVTDSGTRLVAGMQAKCFTVKMNTANESIESSADSATDFATTSLACYHPQALLTLYMENRLESSGETMTMVQEALEFNLNAQNPAIFEPPVPPALLDSN